MKSKTKNKGIITLILLIVLVGGFYIFYSEGSLPVNKEKNYPQMFVIREGDDLNTIVTNLKNSKLIRSRVVFYLTVLRLGIDKNIQAGDFRLNQAMSAEEIAKNLTHGTVDSWITIIEGWRKEEVAEAITKKFNIPEVEFISKADEGYLFPDTYLIPNEASADAALQILYANFNNKFTPNLEKKAGNLGLSKEEAVTLASIIEREAKFDQDRAVVASILLRRLDEGIPLQIDATVQYVLGYQENEKTWWKKKLTLEDLKIDSPYNTYVNPGLPPGPISNPGLSSLEAVANGDSNTPYLFYVSDRSGKLHYAKDLGGHNANIQKYLQ